MRNLYKSLARLEVLRYKPKTYWELGQKLHDRLGDSEAGGRWWTYWCSTASILRSPSSRQTS